MSFLGAKAALFLGDRMLVFLRDDRPDLPWPGAWDFPGGGREEGETPWQTLSREVEEEAGLDLGGAEVLWRHRTASGLDPAKILWFYVARLPETAVGEVLFGEEGQAWALMAPEAVLRLPSLVPHHRPRMERYRDLAGSWGAPVAAADWDSV